MLMRFIQIFPGMRNWGNRATGHPGSSGIHLISFGMVIFIIY